MGYISALTCYLLPVSRTKAAEPIEMLRGGLMSTQGRLGSCRFSLVLEGALALTACCTEVVPRLYESGCAAKLRPYVKLLWTFVRPGDAPKLEA